MESGYYEKRPRPQHRQFLEQALLQRPVVDSAEFTDDHRFTVHREGKITIRGYLTNQYQLGVADIMEILQIAPEINCIVSTMGYNHYSSEAKSHARDANVGLFKASEFLGAIYYDGDRFLDYVPPRDR